MKTVEIVYDYSIMVNGLFGRNRKSKLEHFTLINDQPNELTEEEVETKLKEFISKLNLKSGKATVKVYKVEASTETLDGVTFQSKLLNPFDAKVVKQISV
jgi:hypothetical protein